MGSGHAGKMNIEKIKIDVIIPLAGRGTRMRPLTCTKAKCLLPVAGKPVIDHVLDRFGQLDVQKYIFITGYLGEQVRKHIATTNKFASVFVEQQVQDGTAGAVRLARPHVNSNPVLICFVDTVFDADLSAIDECEDDGIIWVQEVEDYHRFGVVIHDGTYVTDIIEKPNEPVSKLANIGVYFIRNTELLFTAIEQLYANNQVNNGEYYLTDAFRAMIKAGAKIRVAKTQGWHDCGEPGTTLRSNAELLCRSAETLSEPVQSKLIEPVYIGAGCRVERSTIGPNVSIAAGCTIADSTISNSIIDADTQISGAQIEHSLIGQQVKITGPRKESSLMLGDYSVLQRPIQ
jgi:glucose-1-phosphate thymidylyltransferase